MKFPTILKDIDGMFISAEQTNTVVKRIEEWAKGKGEAAIRTPVGTPILLPIPNQLQDSISHNWEASEGYADEAGGLVENVVNKVFGDTATDIAKKAMGKSGAGLDPAYWQMYNGSQPRSFSFSWSLIPNNSTEAATIQNIIKTFKQWAAPTKTGESAVPGIGMMREPNTFMIRFSNEHLNNALKLDKKGLVCTSINVNYNGQGYASFFHDNYPKQVDLEMSFSERSTMYHDDWV